MVFRLRFGFWFRMTWMCDEIQCGAKCIHIRYSVQLHNTIASKAMKWNFWLIQSIKAINAIAREWVRPIWNEQERPIKQLYFIYIYELKTYPPKVHWDFHCIANMQWYAKLTQSVSESLIVLNLIEALIKWEMFRDFYPFKCNRSITLCAVASCCSLIIYSWK